MRHVLKMSDKLNRQLYGDEMKYFNDLSKKVALGLGVYAAILMGASAQTVKIGVIAALTGGGATWGIAASEGVKIAAAEMNSKGGIEVGGKKYKVEIISYDDQYKAADAVAAYNRLTKQDGAKYVFILASAGALALKQTVEDEKVVALTTSYSSKVIDAKSKYMFRLFSVSADYNPDLIKWVKNNNKERRIFFINPNDEAGWDQQVLLSKLYKDNGYEILGNELYERTQKDFAPLLTKVLALKPDVIDVASTPPGTAGLMVRQARELGYKGLFLKTGGAGPKDIVAAAGKEAAEGMVSILYTDSQNPGYRRIAAEYKKTIGQEPNEIIVSFYDAANVLMNAIQKGGDVNDTSKVIAAIPRALPAKSATGETLTLGGKATTGADQQIMTPMPIGVIKNGNPEVVGFVR